MAEIKVKKPTAKEQFAVIRGIVEASGHDKTEELVEFINKKIESLEKKNSSASAKKNDEHEAVMNMIVAVLCGESSGIKCGEIMKKVNAENDTEFSSNKISAMLRKLIERGEVVKVVDKKDTLFLLA